jgi:chromosomal replication initiation ATPase DnaA
MKPPTVQEQLDDLSRQLTGLRRDIEFRCSLIFRQLERPPEPAPWQGTAAGLQERICKYFGMAPATLTSQSRRAHLVRARGLYALLLRDQLDLDDAQIAKLLKRDRSLVPRAIEKARKKIAHRRPWRQDYETLSQIDKVSDQVSDQVSAPHSPLSRPLNRSLNRSTSPQPSTLNPQPPQ